MNANTPARKRILVHEPNKALWGLWGHLLRSADLEVAALTASLDNPRANQYVPAPDLVVIQLPDGPNASEVLDTALFIQDEHGIPVLLVSATTDRAVIREAAKAGLYSFLAAPINQAALATTVELTLDTWRALKNESKKLEALRRKDASRGVIQEAKSILMRAYNYTEEDAYRKLRTESMNARRTMGEVAQAVLNAHSRSTLDRTAAQRTDEFAVINHISTRPAQIKAIA